MENNIDVENNKKKLVMYLSALLKYDWERSKEEVRDSVLDTSKIMFSIILIISMLCLHYVVTGSTEQKPILIGIMLATLCALVIIGRKIYKSKKNNENLKYEDLIKNIKTSINN